MDKEKQKCSLANHSQVDAIVFCPECRIFMCNKCEKNHLEILSIHHLYKLDKDINYIFTGFCNCPNHKNELNYFCKTHNILCCAECIVKIKDKIHGHHHDCDVCLIEDIVEEKKNNLKENINILEKLFNDLLASFNELQKIFEKINNDKEDLKLKIQKIFTKIRNILNDREDKLLSEIDNKFSDLFFNEDIIKKGEKLPNKIKESLNIGKNLINKWDNKNITLSIYNCLNIENNINEINIINDNLNKTKLYNKKQIVIKPEEKDMNEFLETIKNFGKIYYNNYNKNYHFKCCPINIKEERKFVVTGDEENIITKVNKNGWTGTICKNELDKSIEEHIWKVKILKTTNYYSNIFIGIATSDFDINSSSYGLENNKGWYYYCWDGTLFSGPPHNYQRKNINLQYKKNEVTVLMNIKKGTLKFILDKEDKGISYDNIPLDKPIYPSVILYYLNDSLEIC